MAMVLGPGEPPAGPWRSEPVGVLAGLVLSAAAAPPGRPRIVAVDGRSAAGKSTIADALHRAVPRSAVVHTDDVAWHHSFFGWADLLVKGVLEPLHRGEAVTFRPPAWDARARPGAIDVPAETDLVVLEGVGAGRRELAGWLDVVIWVQSDAHLAERRGIERDGGDEAAAAFWHEWMHEEVPFLAEQRPWERANLVVAGTWPETIASGHIMIAPPLTQK